MNISETNSRVMQYRALKKLEKIMKENNKNGN